MLYTGREKKIYHDKLVYEQRVVQSQIRVAKKWRQTQASRLARAEVKKIVAARNAIIAKEKADEESFLRQMNNRMQQEQKEYAAWQTANQHIPLSRRPRDDNDEREAHIFHPPLRTSCLITKRIPAEKKEVKTQQPPVSISRATKQPSLDPHIEALMQKYGQTSIRDGFSRKKRFFDIQL
jgi:hypothetical protein